MSTAQDALGILRRHLPANPEIASALASITLHLQYLLSKNQLLGPDAVAFTSLLVELDTLSAQVALSYRIFPNSPPPCNDCGDSFHDKPCPFLFSA